jgi:hypothetical protein
VLVDILLDEVGDVVADAHEGIRHSGEPVQKTADFLVVGAQAELACEA